MTWWTFLSYAAILWIPAFFIMYLVYVLKSQELRLREYERHGSRRFDEEASYRLRRDMDEMLSVARRATESALEDIQGRSLSLIEHRLMELSEAFTAQLPPAEKRISAPSSECGLLIREISHSLNTPLSQMEAALLTIRAEMRQSDPQGLAPRLQSIQASLDICKSIIASFRELVLATKGSTAWSPQSLKQAIAAGMSVYARQSQNNISIQNELPDEILGYSNNYLVALLIPLIENAVDEALPNSTILVTSCKTNGSRTLEVSSSPIQLPLSNDIYTDGFTTKAGHSGTGLTIVQHLLSAYPSATLTHVIKDSRVTFLVSLEDRG
jgi:K+-sensing histidine kinase KdpD